MLLSGTVILQPEVALNRERERERERERGGGGGGCMQTLYTL